MTKTTAAILCCALLCGCAQHAERRGIVSPSDITPPQPIAGNTGQYMCPYTSDGHATVWLQTALDHAPERRKTGRGSIPKVELPSQSQVQAREAASQKDAAARAGGFDAIRQGSELSFSSADDLCLYLYAKYSRRAGYGEIFDYMGALYPDMRQRCRDAIHTAAGGGKGGGGRGPGSSGAGPGGAGPGGGEPGGGGPGGGMGGPGGGGGPGGMGGGSGGVIIY